MPVVESGGCLGHAVPSFNAEMSAPIWTLLSRSTGSRYLSDASCSADRLALTHRSSRYLTCALVASVDGAGGFAGGVGTRAPPMVAWLGPSLHAPSLPISSADTSPRPNR